MFVSGDCDIYVRRSKWQTVYTSATENVE